jgi:IS1 family transposase
MAKRVCETDDDAWIWMAFAPVWRLVLAFVVGKRTQESAKLLLHRVAHVTAQRLPSFTSDQLPEYRIALLSVYGQWVQPAPTGIEGVSPSRDESRRPICPMHRSSSIAAEDTSWG